MVEEQLVQALDEDVSVLDPFGLAPDWASSIRGLGGATPCPDEAYAFHTSYADFGEGEVVFTATFANLNATRGVLVLRVNAYSVQPGAVAYQAMIDEILIRGIMADGGRAWIRFRPIPGTRYALLGHIYGETDASADGLSIAAERAAMVDAHAERVAAERKTIYGEAAARPSDRLIGCHPPRLAEPVSQLCTARQFDEPVYAEWLDRLKLPPRRDGEQWKLIYILQALRRYGMLELGAQGVGFGVGDEPLPAVIAAIGCKLLVTVAAPSGESPLAAPDDALAALRRPDICPDTVLDQRVSFRAIDMRDLPKDIAGFDFCWSSSAHARLGSTAAGLSFITESVLCLKPGGIAVYTTDFAARERAVGAGDDGLFGRKDLERLALTLIGTGHEVAQLNFELDEKAPAAPIEASSQEAGGGVGTSFGLIVRRGLRR